MNKYYRVQSCFYLTALKEAGIKPKKFSFAAVEKTAPYAMKLYRPSQRALDQAAFEIEQALERIAQCKASGIYPGYNDDEEEVDLRPWEAI
jgi:hypothetical protein